MGRNGLSKTKVVIIHGKGCKECYRGENISNQMCNICKNRKAKVYREVKEDKVTKELNRIGVHASNK